MQDNSFKTYFDSAGVNGTFALFDNGEGHFTIYNLRRYRDSAYSPGATFDIMLSMIGLQTGAAKDDSTLRSLDSVDLFRDLALRIGRDTLKKWIDSLGYGNKNLGAGGSDSFWLDGHLKVKPDEQLGLVKKLYFEQLPFFPRPQRLAKKMMLMESNSNYKLSYSAASATASDGQSMGWVLGFIEENNHPYFFVINLESAQPGMDMKKKGLDILRSSLRQLGFFQGKK